MRLIFDLETSKGFFRVYCDSLGTRNGFKHEATVFKDYKKLFKTKINYLNRTWESYEFESVLNQVKEMIEKESE